MPDHPTCATCKHWDNRGVKNDGMCGKLGRYEHRHDVEDGTDWLVAYDAGYSSILTGPNFGCIHHEPTEPPRAA